MREECGSQTWSAASGDRTPAVRMRCGCDAKRAIAYIHMLSLKKQPPRPPSSWSSTLGLTSLVLPHGQFHDAVSQPAGEGHVSVEEPGEDADARPEMREGVSEGAIERES